MIAPDPLMRVFRHWLVVMRGLLKSIAACAANNPTAATPKLISILQMGDTIEWFALEPHQTPPKLEGRIVHLTRGVPGYKAPGVNRVNVLNVAPGIAAGVNRFLVHTPTEHIKSTDMRNPIDDYNLVVFRLWHNILCDENTHDAVRCWGCGADRQPCPMCMSSVSDECCVDSSIVPHLDMMSHLEHAVGRDVSVCTDAPAMLLPEMRRADLCACCSHWFSERERIIRAG